MFKTTISLSIIIALRFFGLFIVLPVLSAYALGLEDSTEVFVGITIGIYAISQMIMQIPFGMLSDKIGRKQVIFFGTSLFIAGSIICFYAESIYVLIFGRFIQGSGAIGAVATAMISDLTKEDRRTKAMAIMGATIAISFAISMIAGPIIGGYFGVDKLFLLTAFIGVLSLAFLFIIPNPPKINNLNKKEKVNFKKLLADSNLLRMNITNFLQKMFMTMTFMSIPIVMIKIFGWENKELWKLYTPSMLCGLFAMFLAVRIGELGRKSKEMLIFGVVMFLLAYIFIGYAKNETLFVIGIVIFFFGFNMHEPLMQSLASKYAKVEEKGVSLGIFNAHGYFGTFLGGIIGGFFLKYYSIMHLGWLVFFICIAWIMLLLTLENPIFRQVEYFSMQKVDYSRVKYLNSSRGIIEWYINKDSDVLVVKYNSKQTDSETIMNIITA